ncbi:Rhs element Vgr family protein [Paraburkholderia xenovorans LB400]|uniref:Rhs element Vgr protein n=2 Tax=Paraburkholderia xenovorans TaxID=36873 RepID=Q141N4_PARXL|nr:type VI secretion system tip protein TssI/VgrG [Paraburkholderia xenovorans]ABE29955.1 Rhs element Vgr protein [Paraburkholderia xenovorans LB400]AIP32231.1 Rhs element Vgr family protein [Paraburkholderia xenovorans LB400]
MLNFVTRRTLTVSGATLPTLPDGEPALQLRTIAGEETLSTIYEYELSLVTPVDPLLPDSTAANFDLKEMIGGELTVTIQLDGMGTFVPGMAGASGAANFGAGMREISGIVTAASLVSQLNRQYLYRLKMQPWIVLAERRTDYRIFQNKTVVEIIDEVLKSNYLYSYVKRLGGRYSNLVYQVQYGESDFAFIQRLMAEHGIYWFFEHSRSFHRMVLVDNLGAHKPVESLAYQTLWYYPPGHKIDREYIEEFQTTDCIQSGVWTTDDFDFTQPGADLAVKNALPQKTAHNRLSVYEWPGDYTDAKDGAQFARVRMEEIRALGERATGRGHLRNVVCGTTFTLAGYPQEAANREYLVIGAKLLAEETGEQTGAGQYRIDTTFEVQPATTMFRAPRTVAKPRTTGPQTAIVTGPPGQEIWTDRYGRVKLKFHWDHSPVNDQNSSCWVRVSYPWAGSNFGGVNIPRVGQEVIVDFENGDPDRPIVTGRVFNAASMPPWELPGNATQSGMLSRSMKGHYGTANAIRFEDKEGAEELWLQAERDMRTEVEHDESHTVRHDRTRTVGHDESTTIDHDRTEKVGRGEQVDIGEDRRHSIGNDAHLSVGRDHKLRIGKDRIEDIGNNRKDTIGADFRINTGGHVAHTVKGHHQIEAGQAIKRHTPIYQLQAGEAAEIIGPAGKITLDSHGITLEAVRILLKGPVHASTGWVENSLDMRSEVRQCTFTPDFFPFSG